MTTSDARKRLAERQATPADAGSTLEKCEGSSACIAPLHVHGCYADLDGSACDDPTDHAGSTPDDREVYVASNGTDLCVWRVTPENPHGDTEVTGRELVAVIAGLIVDLGMAKASANWAQAERDDLRARLAAVEALADEWESSVGMLAWDIAATYLRGALGGGL